MDGKIRIFDSIRQELGGVALKVDFQPHVNAALVSAGFPFIRSVAVGNVSKDPLPGMALTVEFLLGEKRLKTTHSVPGPVNAGAEALLDAVQFARFNALITAERELNTGVLSLSLAAESGSLGPHLSVAVDVSAANEFLNLPGLQQCIAAFVQPNTSHVTSILRAASDLLLKKTRDGSLNGYQGGPQRAEQIAGAIYAAMAAFDLAYINPPASFEKTGQKVRTTQQVLADRFGTCVDLSVAYAACLEAAGISAVVFFTATHAFPGFFTNDQISPAALVTEPNVIANMVETGQIRPLEMTGIGKGAENLDFHKATQVGAAYVRALFSQIRCLVDIQRARLDRILPLAGFDMDGLLSASEESMARARPFVSFSALRNINAWKEKEEKVTGRGEERDDAPPRFQNWKRDLLDLSLRNPLLNMPKNRKVLDFLIPGGMLGMVDDVIHKGHEIKLADGADAGAFGALADREVNERVAPDTVRTLFQMRRELYSTADGKKHFRQLRDMKRMAQMLEQETGSNYLYLTLGALAHQKDAGGECRAPLFLLPVRLLGGLGTSHFKIKLDGDDIAQPNLCLLEWLRVTKGLALDALARPAMDDAGLAIQTVFAEIRAKLLEENIPYRLDESCSLAILKFSTFQIWKDLDANWPVFMKNPVVAHLAETPGETFAQEKFEDVAIDEESMRLPILADGSQMEAVMRAAQGFSFVLEGPPGTGKSQTIANLIAYGVSRGKRILFVAAKEVALDVVKRRLDAIGVGPFSLELYGAKASMNDIRTQLKRSLEYTVSCDRSRYAAADAKYRSAFRMLRDYPARVHERNGWGHSCWSAWEALENLGDGPSWTPEPSTVGQTDLAGIQAALADFCGMAADVGLAAEDPWILCGRGSGACDAPALQNRLAELSRAYGTLQRLAPAWQEAVDALSPGIGVGTLTGLMAAGMEGLLPREEHLPYIDRPDWREAVDAARKAILFLHEKHGQYLQIAGSRLVTHPALDRWIESVRVLDQKHLFVEQRKKRIREAVRQITSTQADLRGAALGAFLAETAEIRAMSESIRDAAMKISGLLLPADWVPHLPGARELFERAVSVSGGALWMRQTAPRAWGVLQTALPGQEQFEMLQDVARAWAGWISAVGGDEQSIRQWIAGRTWISAWERDAAVWARDVANSGTLKLQRYTELRNCLGAISRLGAEDLADKLACSAIPLEEADMAFLRGCAQASFAERQAKGMLANFDANAQTRLVDSFSESGAALRALAAHAGPEEILEKRPFRAGRVIGEVASLVRQIERKRAGMSFREITKAYPDALLSLCPCFLMSPGSVAHFLDAEAMKFDIVVFDEASQIRVPQAIGAMARGRSVVVVGDSKQMPPTRFMEVDASGEDGGTAGGPDIADLESILSEAAESGLPRMWLRWHYRSSNETLIAFSNKQYYEDRLVTLPQPGECRETGILFRRVDGVFGRGADRTNPIEAQAVVGEIIRRLCGAGTLGDSMGVVCFNVQQRDLILDLLENSEDPAVQAALAVEPGSQLFVKNLENVQGDERDVILFSLAFSPDPNTGVLPLNFGPLNADGGERRLNVAITRARKQVLIFSSFDPKDIDLTRSGARGIRDLKAYLEFAATPLPMNAAVGEAHDPGMFSAQLADALRGRGFEVAAEIGLSAFKVDLAVKKQGEAGWRAAIILDGPAWGARSTVADREASAEMLKTLMGWPAVIRVWLPGWIRDREGELRRLLERVESVAPYAGTLPAPRLADVLEREGGTTVSVGAPAPAAEVDGSAPSAAQLSGFADSSGSGSDSDLGFGLSSVALFTPAPQEQVFPQNVLNSVQKAYPAVCGTARSALGTEGPILLKRLITIVYRQCGYARAGAAKQGEIAGMLRREFAVDEAGFVWPKGMAPGAWHSVRRVANRTDRSPEEVCAEEILCAMCLVLRQSLSIERGELVAETGKMLGYARLSAANNAYFDKVLARGVAENRLAEKNGRIRLSD